jgi:hypothetical protein
MTSFTALASPRVWNLDRFATASPLFRLASVFHTRLVLVCDSC